MINIRAIMVFDHFFKQVYCFYLFFNTSSMYRILINAIILVAIILIAFITIVFSIGWVIEYKKKQEVKSLFKGVKPYPFCRIEEEEIEDFPVVILRYFNYIQLVGSDVIYSARIKQMGRSISFDKKDTVKFESEQYYRGDQPAYLWISDYSYFTTITDSYINGRAKKKRRLFNFFPSNIQEGEGLDQQALLNYFSGMMWFPSAYLNQGILWDATGPNSFKGTIYQQGTCLTAHFEVDEKGALKRFMANDCGEIRGVGIPLKCTIEVEEYGQTGGFMIPFKVKSTFTLPDGDYEIMHLELQEIEYNTEKPY